MTLSVVITSWLIGFGIICASSVSDANNDQPIVYSPEYSMSMGKTLNNTLLKLVGLTFLCNHQPPCSEWSDWSRCCHIPGSRFGTWNRTRVCGYKDPRCPPKTEIRYETDLGLCEELVLTPNPSGVTLNPSGVITNPNPSACPSDYTFTQQGFCLKLYRENANYTEAMNRCKQDGGYLVNINSVQKMEAVKTMRQPGWVYIDGTRSSVKSPWVYSHGPDPVDMNWGPGEPGSNPRDLCMMLSRLYERSTVWCRNHYDLMCEIPHDT